MLRSTAASACFSLSCSRVHRAGRQAGLAPAGQPKLPPHPLPAGFSLCLCKVSPDVDWTPPTRQHSFMFPKEEQNFHLSVIFFFFLTNSQKGMSTKTMMLIYSFQKYPAVGPILFIFPSHQLSHSLHVQKTGGFSGFHSLWVEMGQRAVCGCGFL